VTRPPHLNQPGGRFRAAIHPNIAGRDPGIDCAPFAVDRFAGKVAAGERYVV